MVIELPFLNIKKGGG